MIDATQRRILMVIPSIEGGTLLARMLPTLRHPPAHTVVLDQGSLDDTETVCTEAGVELMQLHRPHTYTEACNIGARLAAERGFPYLCVANNDITFRSDVLGALHAAMQQDPALAIAAPSQLIRDTQQDKEFLSVRVYWDLDRVAFQHDLDPVEPGVQRLEADFCELTCPLIRMEAIDQVGFLDDAYGFYHEDADFGFRLRAAGWSCAYLPQTQIVHYTSSTFGSTMSERKRDYIARNRRYFISKHLGYALRLPPGRPTWSHATPKLHAALHRHGLLAPEARDLVFGHPGIEMDGYLYATVQGTHVPPRWARHATRYRGVFVRSDTIRDAFHALGYAHVHTVPLGIDPDVFHPWGAPRQGGTTFLATCDGWQRGPLHALLNAWRQTSAGHLVLLGRGLHHAPGRAPDEEFATHRCVTARYVPERITTLDLLSPLPPAEAAALFRGVDFAIPGDGGEASAWAALELAACGVPDVTGIGAAAGEPDLHGAIEACLRLDEATRRRLGTAAANRTRAGNTLRHTAFGLHQALTHLQIREPATVLARLDRRERDASAAEALAGSPAAAATPGPAPGLAPGPAIARRLVTLGRLTTRFGHAWGEQGLRAAGQAVATELRYFAAGRSTRATPLPSAPTAHPAAAPPPPAPPPASTGLDPSILLIGYTDAQLGLGQSARGLARAMAAAGIDFRTSPIATGVEGRRTVPFMPERVDPATPHAINVIETTVDELPAVLHEAGAARIDRSYNILRTYWELGRAPEAWRARLSRIHEVWAPNAFVADSFRPIFGGPITVIPPCLDVPDPEPGGHALFGLDPARFHFLFSFDYFSFPRRKNPMAVVRAFRRAFPDPATMAGLVMKATGAQDHHPAIKQELAQAAFLDGRITLLDESLTRAEMLALMTACDCYVSLHRAEGFGLGMAESMALGKPVIATDYSGSTDFISPATAYPVPARLCRLAPDDYVHADNQVWAEPDEAAAAAAMSAVFTHRDAAAARSHAGQAFVRERYGPTHVGTQIAARLAALPGTQPRATA